MFHFKKFSLDDSKAAMKIGTDAVLLGAWAPCEHETRILDIGTGSGILALMMAQQNTGIPIDAVELESEAAAIARANVEMSPWAGQINVFNTTIQQFCSEAMHQYSLVICNPPFFTGSLKAPDKARTLARHNDSLPVEDLLECVSKILEKNGKAAFIIPADAFCYWQNEAAKHILFPSLITYLKSSPDQKPHRVLVVFTRIDSPDIPMTELSIYQGKSVYTQEYKDLTKNYYLHF